MMRLLFLCLLLMLPAATAVSEKTEGSGDGGFDDDDEDSVMPKAVDLDLHSPGEPAGVKETPDHLTLIIIIVAVAVLTLSGAAIITTVLVRRHLHSRQQGIYFVPTEQHQKAGV